MSVIRTLVLSSVAGSFGGTQPHESPSGAMNYRRYPLAFNHRRAKVSPMRVTRVRVYVT